MVGTASRLAVVSALLSLAPPAAALCDSDEACDSIRAALVAFVVSCVMGGLGLYAAVGLVRFMCMHPPVTLRQALQGRHGRACSVCCLCGSFDLARETAEQAQADKKFVTTLVTLFLAGLAFFFFGVFGICRGHSITSLNGAVWEFPFGAWLQVVGATLVWWTTSGVLFVGCCGCELCSPRPRVMLPIVTVSAIEVDPGAQVTSMEVLCPPGVAPGGLLVIMTPEGQQVNVRVPAGVAPGEKFIVMVPLQLAQVSVGLP